MAVGRRKKYTQTHTTAPTHIHKKIHTHIKQRLRLRDGISWTSREMIHNFESNRELYRLDLLLEQLSIEL